MRPGAALLASLAVVAATITAEQVPFVADSPTVLAVKSLARSIELGGATSKATTVYTLAAGSDDGDGSSTSRFIFSLEPSKLSWLDATVGKTSNSKKPLAVTSLGFSQER